VFFASHPQMQERIDNFRQMRSDAGELDDGAAPLPPPSAEFERLVRPLREVWLQRELAQGRYRSVIHHLTQPQSESLYPLHQRAYLGDAYLLRAGDDDAANAQQAYADAVARAPEHPQAWRGLGLLALKRDDRALARQHLQRYLALAGTPPDHAFIRHYLAQLEESR
ncbi:MAG TPA: hypothetical protein VM491_18300, partial [Burkholderiaceae bacterium]|nr:hypothetical protein [Burkholderiaceae bacterium]